jgi:hypothetical protein
VRMVLDCTEYRIQARASRKSARIVWSDNKEAHTANILAAIAPCGAFVWSSSALPCRISDIQICEHWGFLDLLDIGDCSPVHKGFDGLVTFCSQRA